MAWDEERAAFAVDFLREDPASGEASAGRCYARNVALGIGTEPTIPAELRELVRGPGGAAVLHAADYLSRRSELLGKRHVTVVGSGQSGAEVFLDLLRARPVGAEGLHWISRSASFAPMEYSKLGLEQFTPDYTRFFRSLPEETRDRLLPQQWQLYKGISAETIGEIHDELYRRAVPGGWPDAVLRPATAVRGGKAHHGRIELIHEGVQEKKPATSVTDAVVLATGYQERSTESLIKAISPYVSRDAAGRPLIDADYRMVLDGPPRGSLFVQNAERHTHGVGAPDLGLAAWRAATIVNAFTGHQVYPLPARTAFTTFGHAPDETPVRP